MMRPSTRLSTSALALAACLVSFAGLLAARQQPQAPTQPQVSTHAAGNIVIRNEILVPAEAEKLAEELQLLLATWTTTYGLDVGEKVTLRLIHGQGPADLIYVESPNTLTVRFVDLQMLTSVSHKNVNLMRTIFYPIVYYSLLQPLSTPVGIAPGFIQGLVASIGDDVIRRTAKRKALGAGMRTTPVGLQALTMMNKAVKDLGMDTVSFVLATTLASHPAGHELGSELRDAFVAASDEETVKGFFPESLARAAAGIRIDRRPMSIAGLPPDARVSTIRVLGDVPLVAHNGPPLSGPQRGQLFDATWLTILINYPDPRLKGVDWPSLYTDLRSQLAFCRTDAEFFVLMREMVGSLQDANTRFVSPDAAPVFHFPKGIETDLIGNVAVVTRVGEDLDGSAAQVQRGMIVESVNGVPAAERIERIVEYERLLEGLPNDRTRRMRAGNIILSGCPGTTSHFVFRGADEETLEVDIPLEPYAPGPPKPTVESRIIEDQIGYIRLRAFDQQTTQGFDDAIKMIKDARGLVIDLRASMSGAASIASQCMARLLEKPTTVGNWRFRNNKELQVSPMHVAPRVPVYSGPVVLIVDGYCFGTAEIFAWALKSLGRVTLVGQQTAGNVYAPRPFPRNIGSARLMMGRLEFLPGETTEGVESIEGKGLPVDIAVVRTVENVRAGDDPELDRAVAFLKENG